MDSFPQLNVDRGPAAMNSHHSSGAAQNGSANLPTPHRSGVSVLSGRTSQESLYSLSRPDYEVFFKHGLDKRFECPVCCQILRYPVQFECGHRCCSACLPELLRSVRHNAPSCACLSGRWFGPSSFHSDNDYLFSRVAPRCPIDQIKVERERVSGYHN